MLVLCYFIVINVFTMQDIRQRRIIVSLII